MQSFEDSQLERRLNSLRLESNTLTGTLLQQDLFALDREIRQWEQDRATLNRKITALEQDRDLVDRKITSLKRERAGLGTRGPIVVPEAPLKIRNARSWPYLR
jgi:predicted  nucleic acid-binding Zn-ribbon protein